MIDRHLKKVENTKLSDPSLEQQSQDFTKELQKLYSVTDKLTDSYLPKDTKQEKSTSLLDRLRGLLASSPIFGSLAFLDLCSPAENYFYKQQAMFNFQGYYAFFSSQLTMADLSIFESRHKKDAEVLTDILTTLDKLANSGLSITSEKDIALPKPLSATHPMFLEQKFNHNSLIAVNKCYKSFMDKANELIAVEESHRKKYPYKAKWQSILESLNQFLGLNQISTCVIIENGLPIGLKLASNPDPYAPPIPAEDVQNIHQKIQHVIGKCRELTSLKKNLKARRKKKSTSSQVLKVPSTLSFPKIKQRSELLDRKQASFSGESTLAPLPTEQITILLQSNPEIPEDLHQLLLDFHDYFHQTGEFKPITQSPIKAQQNKNFLNFMAKCCHVCNVPEKPFSRPIGDDRLPYFHFLRATIQKKISAIQAKNSRSNDEKLKTRLQQSKVALCFLLNQLNYHSLFFDQEQFNGIINACDDLMRNLLRPGNPWLLGSRTVLSAFKDLLNQCFSAQLIAKDGSHYSSMDAILANRYSLEKEIFTSVKAIVCMGMHSEEEEAIKSRVLRSISYLFASTKSLTPKVKEKVVVSKGIADVREGTITSFNRQNSVIQFFDEKEKTSSSMPPEFKPIIMTAMDIYPGETDCDVILKKGKTFLNTCVAATLLLAEELPQFDKIFSNSIDEFVSELMALQEKIIHNLINSFKNNPSYDKRFGLVIGEKIRSFFDDYIQVIQLYEARHPKLKEKMEVTGL